MTFGVTVDVTMDVTVGVTVDVTVDVLVDVPMCQVNFATKKHHHSTLRHKIVTTNSTKLIISRLYALCDKKVTTNLNLTNPRIQKLPKIEKWL